MTQVAATNLLSRGRSRRTPLILWRYLVSVEIIFDQAIDRSPPIRVGPVGTVVLGHGAMRAGSSRFLRHVDGGWHVGGASYLRARIVPLARGGEVRVTFEGPWHRASP